MRRNVIALLITGMVGVISYQASAADLPTKAPKLVPAPFAFRWTGCFVGGHVGGLWAHKSWTLTAPDPTTPLGSHNADSWLGGAQVGCDYQFANNFVIGIQGDYAWTDAKGSHVDVVDGTVDRTRISSLASVTGRVGYAWDRWLAYARGGAAWVRDKYDRTLIGTTTIAGFANETRSGWTAGVGGEYAFTDFLSGFVEYDYYGFGSRTITFIAPDGTFNDNIIIKQHASIVKAGLNFRFGVR
jgi:outer membrane immunogenic protein